MTKIEFKNLPDTSTPLNASNLNTLQDNVENAIDAVAASIIAPDDAVSTISTNAVENQAITNYVDGEISDIQIDITNIQGYITNIQQDITDINGKLYDTGWVRLTITGTSVWERDNGATPRYRAEIRRIGNLVQVKGNLMANSNLSDNQSVSIPSAYLSQFFTTEMEISGITNNSNWWVDSNGVFHISSSSSSYININSCYMWVNS